MAVYPGITSAIWNTRAVSLRKVRPFILAGIHVTDNKNLATPENEANYSNRWGSGASFHFVIGRDGRVIQCADPVSQVAWTNGSWLNPNWSLWSVNHAVRNGIGANDSTFMTIEHVGYEGGGHGINATQIAASAKLIAWGRRVSGIAVTRATVLGHRDYDSVNRLYCPTRYNLEGLLGQIIYRANQILTPAPAPTTIHRADGARPAMRFRAEDRQVTIRAGKPIRDGASINARVLTYTQRDEGTRVVGRMLATGSFDPWYIVRYYVGNGHVFAYVPAVDLK